MNLIEEVFGTHSERKPKMIRPVVTKIESLHPEMMTMLDEELRDQTKISRERLADGATLGDALPEVSAITREAARRTLNMEYFPVQLIGGVVLYQGRIAEMHVGEDKTLVSTCPAYLNTLKGEGIQIVAASDYLAKCDAEWMGQVHRFLGMTMGAVLNDMTSEQRKEAHACGITYVTNNELGFDYLRDNMSIYKEQLMLRDPDRCIIDEVGSILINEARMPLIISSQNGRSIKPYEVCDVLARQLGRGTVSKELSKIDVIMGGEIGETGDFVMDEKNKVVNLTERGIRRVEEYFHAENLADSENLEIQHNIILVLRANNPMFRNKDYVVKDDEVLIVDEFIGYTMPGRRCSGELHQATEAKEYANVRRESRTLTTITFQNFFNGYTKKAGMTGTAQTKEKEFCNIYAMDATVIPTNRPMIRKDLEGVVYEMKKEKYKVITDEMEKTHEKGQPVLVGTIAIGTSELLNKMLTKKGIPYKVLNAKFHELETEIVADIGIHGLITIATDMTDCGTDIKLDEKTRALGGLKIIGTGRHESYRIDNRLHRHSGYRGDPSESRFYLSLGGDLLRLFGSDRLMAMFEAMGVPEGRQIEHKILSNVIKKAQMKIESDDYDIREQPLKFDEVSNEQREVIYVERRKVLDSDNMCDLVLRVITDTVEDTVDISVSGDQTPDKWDLQGLNSLLLLVIPLKPITLPDEQKKFMKKNELKCSLKEEAIKPYETRGTEFPEPKQIREIERTVLLKVIDSKWMTYLDDMGALREGIGLRAYGQRGPVAEYKMQGYKMYESMMVSIQEETIRILLHIHVEQRVEREAAAKVTDINKDVSVPGTPKKRAEQRMYPDGPCPCGSGKKYKQRHGRIK